MAIGILVQTLYFFTDLYFVSKLGDAAIAGVTSAGNLWFVVLALTQILNVGTVALVSHAVGAQQRDRANLVFNQSLMLSVFMGVCRARAACIAVAGPVHAHRRRPMKRPRRPASTICTGSRRASALQFAHDRDVRDAARHGHRQADDDPADRHRAGERRARAGAHRRLGHGQAHGRRGRGPREHHRDVRRRDPERVLLPPARKVRRHSIASRCSRNARGAGAGCSIIGLPVGLEFFLMSHRHGGDLLGDPRFRRGCAGGASAWGRA